MAEAASIHAVCVLIGERAVLIRGDSGSGKSALALALINAAIQGGQFARLVADDRVALRVEGGRVIASPVTPLEGLIELRGAGLADVAYEPASVVDLVVDLTAGPLTRLPEASDLVCELEGISFPRLEIPAFTKDTSRLLEAIKLLRRRGFRVL